MSNNKGDKGMQIQSDDGISDKSQVLSLQAVKAYIEPTDARGKPVKTARTGLTEYNEGSILVKSKHPLDQLLRRGIIEGHHYDIGKTICMIRDCAFGRSSGRIYNDLGEGDSGIDAMTLYTVAYRLMTKKQWALIELVCFMQPDPRGEYLNEAEYGALYGIAPNIQSALEALEKALGEARDVIKARIEGEKAKQLALTSGSP